MGAFSRGRAWLIQRLAQPGGLILYKKLFLCAAAFLIALGIRLLTWQDMRAEIMRGRETPINLIRSYRDQAQQMIEDGSLLFPNKLPEKGDVRMLVHPPGYSILIVALYGRNLNQERYTLLRFIQVVCDSANAALIFLIMAELFPAGIAIAGGLLVALSPHLAYYSLWLSPDSLAVFPITLGIYLLLLSIINRRLAMAIAAGVCLGLSCWLRSNALLLAPLLGLALFFFSQPKTSLKLCLGLMCGTILTISPILIRNYVISGHAAVLTVVKGLNLVQGIGELDVEGRFGMPVGDREAAEKDAEWHNKPEYRKSLWSPDGIERDRARFARGLQVIRQNPGWFMRGMLYRAGFILSYNAEGRYRWPFNTSQVPVISSEPTFGHDMGWQGRLVWFSTGEEMAKGGEVLSPRTKVEVAGDGCVEVVGDEREFGDQIASGRIVVKSWSDYVLRAWGEVESGAGAIKVTSDDRRIGLASGILEQIGGKGTLQLGFASGDRREIRIVLSNNGTGGSAIKFKRAELYEVGATPHVWTKWLRRPIRGIQKWVYNTGRGRLLIGLAVILLLLAGRWREPLFLLLVPIYYLLTHSGFSAEYRYILAVHVFLIGLMGISLYCFWALALWIFSRVRVGGLGFLGRV